MLVLLVPASEVRTQMPTDLALQVPIAVYTVLRYS